MHNSSQQQDTLKQQQQEQEQQYDEQYYEQQQQQQQVVVSTTQSVLQKLNIIYSQVLQKQKSLLNELLNLQKLLNYTLSTNPLTQNDIKNEKNMKQLQIQDHKRQFNLQRIGQKIQQIIQQTDQVVVAVQEEGNTQQLQQATNSKSTNVDNKKSTTVSSNTTTNNNKRITILPHHNKKQPQKQLTYKLQPMPQKKPPIPTINRVVQGVNRVMNTTKYIPPRNKNEITGKVTQTKILTQEKVFRPEIGGKVPNMGSSNKVNSSSNGNSGSSTVIKINSSVQKRQTSTITTTHLTHHQHSQPSSTTTTTTSLTLSSFCNSNKQHNLPSLQDTNSISQYKSIRAATNKSIKLKQFIKPTQHIYQQYISKKQSMKKKYNFNKLLEKYQQQEMGHRNLQEKRKINYIKKLSNLGLFMNSSMSNDITHSILKRLWKGYPHIFEFNQLLETMQQQINMIEQQYREDLRSDSKEVYRVQCGMKYIERQMRKIMASTEIEVPQKLELTFSPIKKEYTNKTKSNNNNKQQKLHNSITLQLFYEQLLSLLEQIKQNQSLSTKDLSLLRVIAQVSMHDGRKTSLIVKNDDLQQWRQFYQQVENNNYEHCQ